MPRYDTIIFDLDGTLLDTLNDLHAAVNHALTEMSFPARSLDQVRQFVGNGVAKLMERAVPPGTSPEDTTQALAIFKDWYARHSMDATAPYPGVPELLQALRAKGCKTAVVSNKFDGAVKGLCRTYFGDKIPVAIGESQGVARKPAPDTVRRALAELGAEAAGAVYVGDSDVDIETARNSGVPCLSVSWGFRDRAFLTAHGAARIVDTVADLEDVLTGRKA